ncbi:MAG: Ig-like domain-containing protein [Roseivirga sp.]
MKRLLSNLFSLLILSLLFIGCARITSPEGGPEDLTPPTLVSSVPSNEQTNYTGNTIVLTFDEYVNTQAIESNLIITPALEGEGIIKSKIKKKSVILTFPDPWKDNTTYNINFGNTIQDATNRNIPPDLNLSFSTGDYIDSLQISGTITDLYSKDPVEKALVSLYTITDTLDITSGSASYYARTDTSGFYRFKNLPPGEYYIYSAMDENNNQKADPDEELYGFYSDALNLQSNISEINFDIQRLDIRPLKVSSARQFGKYFDIEFNKAITSYDVLNNDTVSYRALEDNKLRFYNTGFLYNDTIPLVISVNDSINSQLQDTVKFYFNESEIDPDKFDYTISPTSNALIPNATITLDFTKPVRSYDKDSLIFELDSLNFFNLDDSVFTWNDTRTQVSWPMNLRDYIQEDKSLKMMMKPGAFFSVENDTSNARIKNLKIFKVDDAGVINGSVNTDAPNYIIQLLDSRSLKVIQTKYNEPKFSFQYLNAGTYLLKVIIDTNGNGVWDIGNILERTQAEPVTYYLDNFTNTRLIELRKNWIVDDINVSYTVNKE